MLGRWLVISCVALAAVWNPVAPPEHVHESDDHGAIQHIVHRHAKAHFGEVEHAEAHDGVAIDHDDGRVFTFDSVAAMPAASALFAPIPVSNLLLEPPAVPTLDRTAADVELLIHGPPRAPAGLRAPPLVTRL